MKWWLISEEDVEVLRAVLSDDALHVLDSGLHKTDVIPDDFK